jgi:hypothetical protein
LNERKTSGQPPGRYDEPHEAERKVADEVLERDVRVPLLDSFDSPLAMAQPCRIMSTEHGIRLLLHAQPVRNGSDLLVVPSVDGVIAQQ